MCTLLHFVGLERYFQKTWNEIHWFLHPTQPLDDSRVAGMNHLKCKDAAVLFQIALKFVPQFAATNKVDLKPWKSEWFGFTFASLGWYDAKILISLELLTNFDVLLTSLYRIRNLRHWIQLQWVLCQQLFICLCFHHHLHKTFSIIRTGSSHFGFWPPISHTSLIILPCL